MVVPLSLTSSRCRVATQWGVLLLTLLVSATRLSGQGRGPLRSYHALLIFLRQMCWKGRSLSFIKVISDSSPSQRPNCFLSPRCWRCCVFPFSGCCLHGFTFFQVALVSLTSFLTMSKLHGSTPGSRCFLVLPFIFQSQLLSSLWACCLTRDALVMQKLPL